MKLAGFLLSFSGWIIVVGALALLPAVATRTAFVFSGIGVEILGLVFAFRSHLIVVRGEHG